MEKPFSAPQPRPLTSQEINALEALRAEYNESRVQWLIDPEDPGRNATASLYAVTLIKACIEQKSVLSYQAALQVIKKKVTIPNNFVTKIADTLSGKKTPSHYLFNEATFKLAWDWVQNQLARILGNAK